MNYYPFHIGDYVSATRHLSWEEDAAYRRLLDTYYVTEKPLPADLRQVFRLVLATTDSQREAVRVVLEEFFEATESGWINRRADSEILAMQEKQDKQRERANKRWHSQVQEHGIAPALPRHSETNAVAQEKHANAMPPTPTPTPTPINKEPIPSGMGSAPRKRSATAARPDDVAEPVWQDFQRLRAQKRSPLTDTALAGLRREAAKAGIGLGDALAFCCEQGWQGFNAGWYADRTGKQPRASPPAASFRERDAAAASERYRRLTGQESPVVTEIPTMKAIAQ